MFDNILFMSEILKKNPRLKFVILIFNYFNKTLVYNGTILKYNTNKILIYIYILLLFVVILFW